MQPKKHFVKQKNVRHSFVVNLSEKFAEIIWNVKKRSHVSSPRSKVKFVGNVNERIFHTRTKYFLSNNISFNTVEVQNPNVWISDILESVPFLNSSNFERRPKFEWFGSDFGRSVNLTAFGSFHWILYNFLYKNGLA